MPEPTAQARSTPQLRTHEGFPVTYRPANIRAVTETTDANGQPLRMVSVSFSSELPILRQPFFEDPYFEVLGHNDDEVDLFRMNNGANAFYNHNVFDPDQRIGGIMSASLQQQRGVADIRISNRADVDGYWQDIRDGILTTISVGYAVHSATLVETNEEGPPTFRVTWTPLELSFVGVPADPTVGQGRSTTPIDSPDAAINGFYAAVPLSTLRQLCQNGDSTMPDPVNPNATGTATTPAAGTPQAAAIAAHAQGRAAGAAPIPPAAAEPAAAAAAPAAAAAAAQSPQSPAPGASARAAEPAAAEPAALPQTIPAGPTSNVIPLDQQLDQARQLGAQAEANRRTAITASFAAFAHQPGVADLERSFLADHNVTPEIAGQRLLAHMGSQAQSAGGGNGSATAGEDARDKFADGARQVLMYRAQYRDENGAFFNIRNNEFGSFKLQEFARRALQLNNINDTFSDPMQMIGRAFHSTSDFPRLLLDIGQHSLLLGFEEAPEIYPQFTGVGNLSDFRAGSSSGLSTYSNLELVPEGGEFKYGTVQEEGESVALATYGSIFAITRQAIINDDLNAFTQIPRKQGVAARRLIGDLVFSVLFDNALMADGFALFSAEHGNVATTPGAPSVDTISEAHGIMANQVDVAGNPINVMPRFILVQPTDLLRTRQLISSANDPASVVQGVTNPIQGLVEPIADGRMSRPAARAGQWFMLPDAAMNDSIVVHYLNGNAAPFLEEQEGFRIDGIEQKIRIDVAVKAMASRALFQNPGA